MMTATSAVHSWAARELFRLRKFAAAGWRQLLANAEVLATFGPTRLRSRLKPLGRPIGTYDGTCVPACQRQRTNWLHGLPAMSDLCIESAFHRSSSPKRPKMAESSLFSAGGHLPLTQAVPGNLRTGPGGPAGPLYGRTEHGRSRGARGRTPRDRKGVKVSPAAARPHAPFLTHPIDRYMLVTWSLQGTGPPGGVGAGSEG